MPIKEIIQQYYQSLNQKNNQWQDMWADDATFADASGTLRAEGKAAVIKSFTTFLTTVESVAIKQLIVEDHTVCAVVTYTYINAKGEKLTQNVAEITEINGDKLQNQTIYFDLTAYRNFVRGA